MEIENLHRLLKRQMKKHLPENCTTEPLVPFLEAINEAYHGFDRDITQIENTLEQSSKELFVANEELRKNVKNKEAEAERLRVRIENIVNSVRDVVFQTDSEGRWIYLNPAWEINTGFAVEESLGRSFIEFIDPEQKEQSKAYLHYMTEQQLDSTRYTIRYLTKQGEKRWTEAFVNVNRDAQGAIQGYSGTLTDVTERIKAQRDVKRLALVAEKTDNIVFISDAVGKIEWVNRAFEQKMGYSLKEAVGKTARKLMHGAETSTETVQEMKEALLNSDSFSGELYNYTKGGEGLWLSVSVTPIKNKRGKLEGYITIELDISDKKADEQKLIEARNTLNFALEGNGYGIWDWNLITGEVTFSKIWKTMLGYHPNEVEDNFSQWEELVLPEDLPEAKKALQSYLQGDAEHYKTDFRMRTKQGTFRWILAMGKAVSHQRNGKPYRIVGTHQDITERKNAEQKLANYAQELEKINGELDKFAYIVSHDLKAPLRAINNLSEWIEEDLGENVDEDIKEQMRLLRGRVRRMEGLINGILSYSRAGRINSNLKEVNLNELLQGILDTLPVNNNFEIAINSQMPTLLTTELELEQVFANFISNALKYNDAENPYIKVDYRENGSFYHFWVEDNGPGVEEEFQEKVFEIFQTLQARDLVESTGVGLAIVKKIVEEKGGKVWVESKPYAQTRFCFSWPKKENNEN